MLHFQSLTILPSSESEAETARMGEVLYENTATEFGSLGTKILCACAEQCYALIYAEGGPCLFPNRQAQMNH